MTSNSPAQWAAQSLDHQHHDINAEYRFRATAGEHRAATTNEKSDMYVTALDVFNRRTYFGSHDLEKQDAQSGHASLLRSPEINESGAQQSKQPFTRGLHNDDATQRSSPQAESSFCKLKHFSSPKAYAIANSVRDVLSDTLGEGTSAQIYVSHELLVEKRQLFFQTLFTHTDELHTALPCRFSIEDINSLFHKDVDQRGDGASSYQKRVAALDHLCKTLEC